MKNMQKGTFLLNVSLKARRMVPRKAVHLVYIGVQNMCKRGARMRKGGEIRGPQKSKGCFCI